MNSHVNKTDGPDPDAIKMFVGQIPRSMDEKDLRKMFEDFGPVYQLNVLRDKLTNQSKGCCFVTFYTRKAALGAQNALHNIKTMPGMHHPVQMKPADHNESKTGTEHRKLFIGMISKKLNETDIRAMFAPYGSIEECTVLRGPDGVSKGCAFVTYASRQCALNAIKSVHHSQTMEGCTAPMVVKLADTQKDKEQKKIAEHYTATNLWGLQGMPAIAALSPQYITGAPASLGTVAVPQLAGTTGINSLGVHQIAAQLAASANGTVGIPAAGLSGLSSPLIATAATDLTNYTNVQNLSALMAANNPSSVGSMQHQLAALAAMNSHSPLTTLPGYPTGSLPVTTTSSSSLSSANSLYSPSVAAAPGFGFVSANNLASLTGIPATVNGVGEYVSTNGSGVDAITQAYSGMQQYAAGFPTFTQPAVQQQIQTAAGKQTEGPEGANLFIYHLPQEFTDQDLAQTFLPFGTVLSAKVFIDKQTNLSKCFGFISYDNPVSAQAAIQAMNGFQIGMKRLKVQLKRSKESGKPY